MKRISGLGAVLLVIVLGAAACGGSTSDGTIRTKKRVHGAAAPAPTVMVADSPLGKILVDANGHTLYEFDQDTPTTPACTGACASLWPALMVSGTPHAGTGIDAGKLGVLAVTAGSEVTYAGHPLHTFANDHARGDVTGQGFGGLWWVVGADGQKITTPAATPAPTTSAPVTQPPGSEQTSPPETAPPETSPPEPEATEPPRTQPPATASPGTGGIGF